jgi:hypothetical protein
MTPFHLKELLMSTGSAEEPVFWYQYTYPTIFLSFFSLIYTVIPLGIVESLTQKSAPFNSADQEA